MLRSQINKKNSNDKYYIAISNIQKYTNFPNEKDINIREPGWNNIDNIKLEHVECGSLMCEPCPNTTPTLFQYPCNSRDRYVYTYR